MNKTEKLLPCPFCGQQPTEYAIEPHTHALQFSGGKMPDHQGSHVIECACGCGIIDATREEVFSVWNRRPTPCLHQIQEPGPVLAAPMQCVECQSCGSAFDVDSYLAGYTDGKGHCPNCPGIDHSTPQAAPAVVAVPDDIRAALSASVEQIEHDALKIEMEWGMGRNLYGMEIDGDLPPALLQARAALAATPAADAQAQTIERQRMTAGRASFFMERFLREEKLLGPNEQAALHFVIDMLEAAAPAVLPEPDEPTPGIASELADMLERSITGLGHYRDSENWSEADEEHIAECNALLDRFNCADDDERALLATGGQAQEDKEMQLAMQEASSLAQSIFKRHYSDDEHYASGSVVWVLCDSLRGVISQIDNMTSGLVRAPQAKADTRDAEQERWMGIGKAIERACVDLPVGAEIILSLEKDAGTVTLTDEEGDEQENFPTDGGLAGVVNAAIEAAIAAAKGEAQ